MATIKENINQLEQTNAEMREVIGLCYAPLADSEGMVDYPEKLARLAVDDATEQVIATAPRTTAGGVAIKDTIAVVDKIKGQTLVWNQYCKKTYNTQVAGLTFTDTNDGYLTINGTATNNYSLTFATLSQEVLEHIVLIPSGCLLGGSSSTYKMSFGYIGARDIGADGCFGKPTSRYFAFYHAVGQVFENVRMRKPLYFDLTRMFGSGNEPSSLDDFCLKIFGKSSSEVTDAEWESVSAYCEPTLKSSAPKKIVSVVRKPMCDIDGNQLKTSLPNGTILHWRQTAVNGNCATAVRNTNSNIYENYEYYANNSNPTLQEDGSIRVETNGTGKPCGISFYVKENIEMGNYYYNSVLVKTENEISFYNGDRAGWFLSVQGGRKIITISQNSKFEKTSYCFTPESLTQGQEQKKNIDLGLNSQGVVKFNVKFAFRLNLTKMFADCPSLMPTTDNGFEQLVWSNTDEDGNNYLGYTEYSKDAYDVVCYNGKMYILNEQIAENEIDINPTDILDEDGNKVFPNGLLSAGSAKDYIDLERGVAVKCINHKSVSLRAYNMDSSGKLASLGVKFSDIVLNTSTSIKLISPLFPTLSLESARLYNGKCFCHYGKGIYARNSEIEQSVDAYNEWISTLGNVEFIYELATPIEYPLPKRKCFYRVSNGGTERITSDSIIPMVADIGYREAVTASEAVAMLADAAGI